MPKPLVPEALEPDRYELREGPAYQFALDRREFIGVAGAGLLICVTASDAKAQRGGGSPQTLAARLHLGEDGSVTVLTGKVEVGQGSRTEITMAAAEELRLPLDKVRVIMADTDQVPDDGITAGSRTTPSTIPPVRQAAAVARELAAKTGLTYAELAKSPQLSEAYKGAMPAGVTLTAVEDWKTLGTPHVRTDAHDIVTGAHQYPSDIQRPGMLYGSVLRAPAYFSKLEAVDTAEAAKMAGVTVVLDDAFVGCTAPTSFTARKAVEALVARWRTGEHPSSQALFGYLKQHPQSSPSRAQERGSVDKALSESLRKHSAVVEVPFIQHAPMEPRAAVAEWANGKLTVWTGTQNPFGVRTELMQAFHLPPENVRVIIPDTGGGFGGKHTGEVAIEAARLAKEAAKPVSLRWTRAEEFMWAYFRPAGLFEMSGGVDESGKITAWDYTAYNPGTAGLEPAYNIPNVRTRHIMCDSPMRQGSYRGIAATANHFARECFIDELAGVANLDPVEFRLLNIQDQRLRNVVEAAADHFRWADRKKQKGNSVGIGIACGTEKGSYVATCAEIVMEGPKPVVRQIVEVFECGAILNPGNLKAQTEGSVIMGLGGALSEEMLFESGRLLNGSFRQYPVPRFKDVPPIEVVLLNRPDLAPAGAGETPIITVAPAIANAVWDATGKRVRRMPVKLAV